jgi:preprotein translocase subunit SecD
MTETTHEVRVTFTESGAKRLLQVTTDHIGKKLVILVKGEIRMAPLIRLPLEGGEATITGGFTPEEAKQLADVLSPPLSGGEGKELPPERSE